MKKKKLKGILKRPARSIVNEFIVEETIHETDNLTENILGEKELLEEKKNENESFTDQDLTNQIETSCWTAQIEDEVQQDIKEFSFTPFMNLWQLISNLKTPLLISKANEFVVVDEMTKLFEEAQIASSSLNNEIDEENEIKVENEKSVARVLLAEAQRKQILQASILTAISSKEIISIINDFDSVLIFKKRLPEIIDKLSCQQQLRNITDNEYKVLALLFYSNSSDEVNQLLLKWKPKFLTQREVEILFSDLNK